MAAEEQLLERAQTGEEAAFTDLVRLYERRLRAYARAMVHNDEDADDLTQEALLRIFRALPLFQRQSSFSTWAFRILTRVCLDHLRQCRRRPQGGTPPSDQEDLFILPDKGPGPEELLLQAELRASLRAALAQLPVEQRLVVVLHDVCAFKYREIATIAKCSEGTVKSRLFTARARLRQLLGLIGETGG
ncbi:MAG: RNA polymerase sigma factor [Bacteroidota bacterium]